MKLRPQWRLRHFEPLVSGLPVAGTAEGVTSPLIAFDSCVASYEPERRQELMFKILVLQTLCTLSDEQTECSPRTRYGKAPPWERMSLHTALGPTGGQCRDPFT